MPQFHTGIPTNTNPKTKYSYVKKSYTDTSYTVLPGIVPPQFAKASEYVEPLRALIEIRDMNDPNIIKYSYDSFKAPNNAIMITEAEVTVGQGQTGDFSIKILDNEKVIPRSDLRRNNVIVIKAKKYEGDQWINLLYGFQKRLTPTREKGNLLEYRLDGFGSGILLGDRVVNFKRMPKSFVNSLPGSVGIGGDPSTTANSLFKQLFTANDILLVGDNYNLTAQGKFDLTSIPTLVSPKVNDQLYGMNEKLVEAREIFNKILDLTGADGGVDAYNRPFLRYHSILHSGITLKTWEWANDDLNVDLALNTGYFFGPFGYTMDWSKESGFANRLVAQSVARPLIESSTEIEEGATVVNSSNFKDLIGRDLGVRFPVGSAKLQDIALLIQRIGDGGRGSLTFEGTRTTTAPIQTTTFSPTLPEPTSALFGGVNSQPVLHGHICRDFGGFPIGGELATFEIPLDDIPEEPTPMFLLNMVRRGTVSADDYAWILLYCTSMTDSANCIRWFHNGKGTDTNGYRAVMKDHNSIQGWTVDRESFAFIYNIYDTFTFPIVAEDTASQEMFGLVEDTLDLSWAPTNSFVNKYLNEELNIRKNPKIVYEGNSVSIPNGDRLYESGLVFSIGDALTDIPLEASYMGVIEEVTYPFGTDDTALGCRFVDLTPLGYYNFKADQETFG